MDYDFYFVFDGEKINYLLDRSNYVVHKSENYQENPKVSTGIKLFFDNGDTLYLPITCRQNELMPIKPKFVEAEYIKYLKEHGKLI